jgi:hypothetical protein
MRIKARQSAGLPLVQYPQDRAAAALQFSRDAVPRHPAVAQWPSLDRRSPPEFISTLGRYANLYSRGCGAPALRPPVRSASTVPSSCRTLGSRVGFRAGIHRGGQAGCRSETRRHRLRLCCSRRAKRSAFRCSTARFVSGAVNANTDLPRQGSASWFPWLMTWALVAYGPSRPRIDRIGLGLAVSGLRCDQEDLAGTWTLDQFAGKIGVRLA